MVITRIPVETQEEGENYLAKLVEYETAPPAEWNKNFLFIGGGDVAGGQFVRILEDIHEFIGDSLAFRPGNSWGGLGNPPISIHPTIIGRTDLINPIDVTHIGDIQTAFKAGQSLVY